MGTDVAVGECSVGRGVFAQQRYLPGDTVLIFRGRRVDRSDPLHWTPEASNLIQTGRLTYIYPEAPGVFVNHSCNPNCGIAGHRRLIALREILPGQEFRFDYSTTMDDDIWTLECLCGEPECRGLVMDFRHLPWDVRTRYLELGIVPGFIAARYRNHEPARAMVTSAIA